MELFTPSWDTAAPKIHIGKNNSTEQTLLNWLGWNDSELNHFNQNYTHPHSRLAHLSSRYLLKKLGLEIEKNAAAKPFLGDNSQQIALSHTHLYSVVALHHSPVGVDVEEISPRFARIKHKFVDKKSLSYAQGLDNAQQEQFFAYYWTAKEAVYKIKGESLANYAEMITIEPFIPEKNRETFAYLEKSSTFAAYKLIFLPLSCNHLVAVAY